MRHLLALILLLSASVQAADVTFDITDFAGTSQASKRFHITPLGVTTNASGVTTLDRKSYTVGTDGTYTVTNMAWPITYKLEHDGAYTKTTYNFSVLTNGTFNFRNLLTTSIATPSGSSAYTIAAADAKFATIANFNAATNSLQTQIDNIEVGEIDLDGYATIENLVTTSNVLQTAIDTKVTASVTNGLAPIALVTTSSNALQSAIDGLTTTDIPEGSNLYWTDARILAATNGFVRENITNGLASITLLNSEVDTLEAAIALKADDADLTALETVALTNAANVLIVSNRLNTASNALTTLILTNAANTLIVSNSVFAPSATVSASAIDWSLGNVHVKTLTGNTTFTFSNARDGQTIVVKVVQTSGNSYTVTWPAATLWPEDEAPTQSTNGKDDIYTFIHIGGTNYGSYVQGFVP